jgi:zinc protease
MIIRSVLAFVVCVMWTGSAVAGMLPIQTVTSVGKVTAWLVEDHTVPVVSLVFSFRGAGAVNDPENKQGLSRMLSNTLDEGAGPLDSKAFQAALNDQSISLSFLASRDDFGGKLKTLSQNREEAFYLLRLALTKPRLETEAIERMRDANLSRIKGDMTDPNWMAARLVNDVVFQNHPYALNSGGTLTTLKNITAIDLREKATAQLTRDRLIVGVAGDITPEQLKLTLDKIFGELPEKAVSPKIAEVTLPSRGGTVLYPKDIPQTVLEMVLPGIRMTDPDYFAATVMNHIFGGGWFRFAPDRCGAGEERVDLWH